MATEPVSSEIQAEIALLRRIYDAFNARDVDAVLAEMTPDVAWPRAWKGGWVSGQDAVREYWTAQWKEIDPIVTPEEFSALPDGRLRVSVRQTVKDLSGGLLFDGQVQHVYTFAQGSAVPGLVAQLRVAKMEIEE